MIDFYFDISSPWTYLAFHNIQPMASELGVAVRWKPILVGGVFNTVNPSVYETRERGVPAKLEYHVKDLQDWARHAGIRIVFPPAGSPYVLVILTRGVEDEAVTRLAAADVSRMVWESRTVGGPAGSE